MKYKTSDLVIKARQLADLTNSDFLAWDEIVSLVNDSYTAIYQKLININDASFVNTITVEPGENVLPPDFWQLRSVNLVRNKEVLPIKRRASSENYSSLSYEIRFDKLYIHGSVPMGEIVVEYWAKPKTLTYKPEPVELSPTIHGNTLLAIKDEKFFSVTSDDVLFIYDTKTGNENNIQLGGSPSKIYAGKDKAVIKTNNGDFILTYVNMNLQAFTGVPVITEGGSIARIYEKKIFLNNHYVADWDFTETPEVAVCGDYFEDFYYLVNGTIYHNGEPVLLNDQTITATGIAYKNGNCWYYTDEEIGFVDADDNFHLVDDIPGVVGINKIDENTGYGYTVKDFSDRYICYPWVEDTILDFPNSMYFQIIPYALAVAFKVKQGADASGLTTIMSSMEQTFYDTLTQDANQSVRIKNVY
jgi:hypothetical protein